MGLSSFRIKAVPLSVITNNYYVALFVSRCTNRRFILAIAATSILSAKVVHIYAHLNALLMSDIWTWGLSFFAQDTILLITLYLLLDKHLFQPVPRLASAALGVASFITTFVLALATCNISFFSLTGSEIHWSNIGFLADPSSIGYLLMGLASSILTFSAIAIFSWLTQDVYHFILSLTLDIIEWPFKLLWTKVTSRQNLGEKAGYIHLQQQDVDSPLEEEGYINMGEKPKGSNGGGFASKWKMFCYVALGLGLSAQALESMTRPLDKSFIFVSWTLPLVPFVDFAHSSTSLFDLLPVFNAGIGRRWDNLTALGEPVEFSWLPQDTALPGFDDWFFKNTTHYRADQDPLKISNLDNPLRTVLKDKLSNIKIRHVMLVKLESTRKDVFPFKKDGTFWESLANSFPDKQLPSAIQERLANLTPTANFITGDYNDGFNHQSQKKRGGINFKNARTSSSYTLKSLTATLCGLAPLVVDWNVEVNHHIYQPCLPHIFNAMNKLNKSQTREENEFDGYKWKSLYMQSVNGLFDRQNVQMPLLGFAKDEVIDLQYLMGPSASHGKAKPEKGRDMTPEFILEPYIRDALASAKQKNERLFLTHLTSTTHAPFKLFQDSMNEFMPFHGDKSREVASNYLNTIGYVDRWLGRLLQILDDEGVADETLVIFMGDHGLPVAEKSGGVTPYYAWRETAFHIPLVLSHPKLPSLDVDAPVVSMEVLPTILDLLRETGSLSEQESRAALDLMENYEGQSLVRPVKVGSGKTSQPDWQFTVTNPGRSTISIHDPQYPKRHLIVPVIDDVEWRFTADVDADPLGNHPLVNFSFRRFIQQIKMQHGIEAAKWAESAAFAARWWMKDTRQRWRYDPLKDGKGPFSHHH